MARKVNINVRNNRSQPSFGRVLFHFLFGLLTGGLWWLWLLVRALIR